MDTTVLILCTLLLTFLTALRADEQCEAGKAGVYCNLPCPTQCKNCDRVSQDCTENCKTQHHFGKRCEQICPKFCDGACNITTGSCFRCLSTHGGTFCNISCPENCRSTCDMNTLECDHCKTNFTGAFCNYTCQGGHSNTSNLKSCIQACRDERRYGDDCEKPCPENCKEGCYRDTGECFDCTEGFGGKLCNVSCSVNCLNWCERYQGICNDCKVGYSGERCSEKCPANCKDKCDKNTGHCIECESGFQGKTCTENFTQNCNGSCDQTTGICIDENTGRFKYGRNCDQATGENKLDRSPRPKHKDKSVLTVACVALGGSLVVLAVTLTFVLWRRRHRTRQTQKDNVCLVAYYRSRIDDDETTTTVGTNEENSRLTNYEEIRVPMKHKDENPSINLDDTKAEEKRPDESYQIDNEDAIEGEDHQKANQAVANHCMEVGDQSDVLDTEKSTTSTNVNDDGTEDDVSSIDEKDENLKEEAPEKIYVDIMAVRGY